MLELSGGGNLLIEAAAPLLVFATRVQKLTASTMPSKDKLMEHLTHEMQVFEDKIKHAGYATDIIGAANYSLCALLDEMIMYNKIGYAIQWNGYELLRSFIGETSDGQDFFAILHAAIENPVANLDLLGLLYLCLTLGFEGKYRNQNQGQAVIANFVNELYELIWQYRGEPKNNLLVQSDLPSKFAPTSSSTIKKRINWERLLVGGIVVVIGLSVYLNWNMQLSKHLVMVNKEILNVGF